MLARHAKLAVSFALPGGAAPFPDHSSHANGRAVVQHRSDATLCHTRPADGVISSSGVKLIRPQICIPTLVVNNMGKGLGTICARGAPRADPGTSRTGRSGGWPTQRLFFLHDGDTMTALQADSKLHSSSGLGSQQRNRIAFNSKPKLARAGSRTPGAAL